MSILPIRHVLVVESDAAQRVFVVETLKLLGVPTVESCDRLARVQFGQAAKVDLVISQWEPRAGALAGMFPHRPIVLITPTCVQARTPGFEPACAAAGPDAILPQPFTRSTLLKTLKDLVTGPAGRRLKVVELPRRHSARLTSAPQPPGWLRENGAPPQA